jgi:hypothetical protein
MDEDWANLQRRVIWLGLKEAMHRSVIVYGSTRVHIDKICGSPECLVPKFERHVGIGKKC